MYKLKIHCVFLSRTLNISAVAPQFSSTLVIYHESGKMTYRQIM